MAEDLFHTWHPLDFSTTSFPKNLPNLKRLTEESNLQKERLQKEISNKRYENLKYLNEHLEIRAVLREFMQEITKEFPDDSQIPTFCNKLFGQCKVKLQAKILSHVRDLEQQRRQKLFPFTRKTVLSTSSEGFTDSTTTTSSSGLFVSSTSGSQDLVCDCRKNISESQNSSESTSSCTCPEIKPPIDCCECSMSYKSGNSCQCNMSSTTSCNSGDIDINTTQNSAEECDIELQQKNSAEEIEIEKD